MTQSNSEFYPKTIERIGSNTPKIMERYASRFLSPDALTQSREVPQAAFDKLFEKYSTQLNETIDLLFEIWDRPEHSTTIGHDRTHISFDLYEFLEFIEHTDLPQSDEYMVLFGSMLHDLGRYPELELAERSGAIDFDTNGLQIQLHAALSGYIGAEIARKFNNPDETDPDIVNATQALTQRTLNAAIFHGGKNYEADPVVWHVQSSDRLAGILGVREFVRNVTTDCVQRGAAVYPDERLDYSTDFPRFNNLPTESFAEATVAKNSWTNLVHYLEMPVRNIFPLSNEHATIRANEMRRQSGILLTLLSGGEQFPLYQQIFAPELNPDSHSGKFPKTRLPNEIWEQIQTGPNSEEHQLMEQYDQTPLEELITIMLAQQAPDISDVDRLKVIALLGNVTPYHQEHIRQAIQYVICRRYLDIVQEHAFLVQMTASEDPLKVKIANKLIQNPIFN